MSGTKIGGLKAAVNNTKNDPGFYARIGSIGGRNGNTGGVYNDPKRAAEIGSKGGKNSIRGYKYLGTYPDGRHYQRRSDGEIVVK